MRNFCLFILFVFTLGFTSCRCKPNSVACPQVSSTEADWIKLNDTNFINMMDTANHVLVLNMSPMVYENNDAFCSKPDCACNCESSAILNGSLHGFYGGVNLTISAIERSSQENSDISKEFSIQFGAEKLKSTRTPFFKHNQATFYKTLKIGNREFSSVYKIPISKQRTTDTNLVFQIGDVYISETEGIVGLNNRVDSLVFFKVK